MSVIGAMVCTAELLNSDDREGQRKRVTDRGFVNTVSCGVLVATAMVLTAAPLILIVNRLL